MQWFSRFFKMDWSFFKFANLRFSFLRFESINLLVVFAKPKMRKLVSQTLPVFGTNENPVKLPRQLGLHVAPASCFHVYMIKPVFLRKTYGILRHSISYTRYVIHMFHLTPFGIVFILFEIYCISNLSIFNHLHSMINLNRPFCYFLLFFLVLLRNEWNRDARLFTKLKSFLW